MPCFFESRRSPTQEVSERESPQAEECRETCDPLFDENFDEDIVGPEISRGSRSVRPGRA